jgi:hypothetical protein
VSGFLGYDPSRLVALGHVLDDVTAEAASVGPVDRAGGEALGRYQRAVTSVAAWRPVLSTIAACAFSAAYRPVHIDPADPSLIDVANPLDEGWTTVTDPRDPVGQPNGVARARHLAAYLATEIDGTFTHVAWLDDVAARVRAARADPAARAVLMAAIGPDAFGRIAEVVAGRVTARGASADATSRADAAEGLMAALATAWSAEYREGHLHGAAWETTIGEQIEPYAGALVLRHAALAGDVVARLAARQWTRWWAQPGPLDASAAERTPDVLVAVLRADPLAARAFLAGASPDELAHLFADEGTARAAPALLVSSVEDGTAVMEAVRSSMCNVLVFLGHHRDLAAPVRPVLGAYAGAYLEPLLLPDDGVRYPVARWSLDDGDGEAVVRWIAEDATAGADLQAWALAVSASRLPQLVAEIEPEAALVRLGTVVGTVDRAVADASVLDAERQVAVWNQAWTLLGGRVGSMVATYTVSGGTGLLVSQSVGRALARLGELWRRNGWGGAPDDPAAVAAVQRVAVGEANARRQAALVALAFRAGVAAGTMPAQAAPPPFAGGDYAVTLDRWVDRQAAAVEEAETADRPVAGALASLAAARTLANLARALDDGSCRATSACDGRSPDEKVS